MPATCPRCDAPLTDEPAACPACGEVVTLDLPRTQDHRPEATVASGPAIEAPDRAPPLVPGYELLGEIGQGGMGIVYQARQLGLNRVVALKALRPGLRDDDKARARFRREAEAMALLNHPGIVHVHEVGEHAGVPYFSMEYVEGGALAERLRDGPLPFAQAAALVEQLARAVFFAHEAGVIHRDLKPANVLLASGGRQAPEAGLGELVRPSSGGSRPPLATFVPKITDFGLARQLRDSGETLAGAIVGTPSYMAPEQARGEGERGKVGKRADVYALGAVLYECLTGRPPFLGETMLDTLAQVVELEPIPPARLRRGCPRDLETICLRCLHKDPERRYVSALSLANDLAHYLAGEPILARAPGWAERALKWARRRPAAAALWGVIALSLGGVIAGMGYLARVSENNLRRERDLRLEIEAAQGDAQTLRARLREDEQRLKGANEEIARAAQRLKELQAAGEETAYYTTLNRADQAISRGDVQQADDWLERCPKHLRHWEWGYLKKRTLPDEMVDTGSLPLGSLALSPDGKLLALCQGNPALSGAKGRVRMLTVAGLERERSLDGIEGAALAAVFRPDGKRLITIGATMDALALMMPSGRTRLEQITRCEAQVWDLATDSIVERWRNVSAAEWSPDGKHLATARLDGRITVRLTANDELHFRSLPQPGLIHRLLYSPNGHWLAATWQQVRLPDASRGTAGAEIFQFGATLWDARTGKLALELEGASALAFHPDGKHLAVGTSEGVIQLWDVAGKKREGELRGATSAIIGLTYDKAGTTLASGEMDRAIRLWDVARRRMAWVVFSGAQPPVKLLFSRNGGRLFCATLDTQLRVWNVAGGGGGMRSFDAPGQPSGSPVFSPDGRRVFVTGTAAVRGYDLESGEELPLPGGAQWSVAVAAKAGVVAIGGPRKVWIYDGARWASKKLLATVPAEEKVLGLALSASGERLFIASHSEGPGGAVASLKAHDWKRNMVMATSGGVPVLALALSRDGKRLAVLRINGAIQLLDPASLKPLHELSPGVPPVRDAYASVGALAFSPDGRYLATGFNGMMVAPAGKQEVQLWDTATGKPHATLPGHDGLVTGVAYSPDGRRLAVSCVQASRLTGGEIKLWDVRTKTEALALPGQRGVAFSGDGRRIAAVGFEGLSRAVLRVWEAGAW